MDKEKTDVREERVSMNIGLSPEDKRFLKVYAIEHDTTTGKVASRDTRKRSFSATITGTAFDRKHRRMDKSRKQIERSYCSGSKGGVQGG